MSPSARTTRLARLLASALFLALVLALVPALSAVVTSPARADVAGQLEVAPSGPVMKNEQLQFTGQLPPARSRTVRLQRQVGDAGWVTLRTWQSGPTGAVSFASRVPTGAALPVIVRYRLTAPAATLDGTSHPAVESPTVERTVVAQQSSLDAPARVRVGTSYDVDVVLHPGRDGRPVTLQRRQGGRWTQAASATTDAGGTASFVRSQSQTGTTTWRVLAPRWRGLAPISTPARTVRVVGAAADVTPPPVPTGTSAVGGSPVRISWDAVSAPDLAGYRVYRGVTPVGPWTVLGDVPSDRTTWEDGGHQDGAVYAVASRDTLGNESARSTPVSPTTDPGDTTPPPVPTGVVVDERDGALRVSWEAVAAEDLGGYRLYRAEGETGPWTAVGGLTVDREATVEGLLNGTTYWFAVSATDLDGNESALSTPAHGTPADTTAPAAPTGFTGVPGDGLVDLAWDEVGADDLAGYRVYREVAGGGWEQVGGDLTTRELRVEGLSNGTSERFAVTAVDLSGNESDRATITVTPSDAEPPADPTGLVATAGEGQVDLIWDAVPAADLAGYRVYRSLSAAGPGTLVSPEPLTEVGWTDTGLANGTEYFYRVVAVDDDGLESAPGATASATPADTTAPPVPTGVEAVAGDAQVDLAWDAVTAPDLAGYLVRTAPSDTGPWTQVGSLLSEPSTTVLGLTNGRTHWFTVTAVDLAGNESAPSDPAAAEPRAEVPTAAGGTPRAGYQHTCRVRADGSAWCWGRGSIIIGAQDQIVSGSLTPERVPGPSDWAVVDPGIHGTCGVRTDGTLWCWGWVGSRQLESPTQLGTSDDWLTVRGGSSWHHCGIQQDRSLWCWGDNSLGQLGDGTTDGRDTPVRVGAEDARWRSVSPGYFYTCGVRQDDTAWCWGNNFAGQLGDGSTADRSTPVQVLGSGWQQVEAGAFNTCGLRLDGSVWCWGTQYDGALGDGVAGFTSRPTPAPVDSAQAFTAVAAFEAGACALSVDERLWCWGRNGAGAVGDGTYEHRSTPVPVAGDVTTWRDLDAGMAHVCALSAAGEPRCWGGNRSGELGDGFSRTVSAPFRGGDNLPADWLAASSGYDHLCGILTDGSLWCRGLAQSGQLGVDLSTEVAMTKVRVGTATDWVTVTSGWSSSCGIRAGDALWCWGGGTATPTQVPGAWSAVDAGDNHRCGLRTDATLWCWGRNYDGQVGDGTITTRSTPFQVGSDGWSAVSAGTSHTCALRGGQVWCWGANHNGQLGQPLSLTRSLSPVRVGTESDWVAVSAGGRTTCAVKVDDTAWCWGSNSDGSLGSGSTSNYDPVPARVAGELRWEQVEVGGSGQVCGLRIGGGVWCWGYDLTSPSLQLGVAPAPVLEPVEMDGLEDTVEISPGVAAMCVVGSDRSLSCWGDNYHAQLGAPVTRATPWPVDPE